MTRYPDRELPLCALFLELSTFNFQLSTLSFECDQIEAPSRQAGLLQPAGRYDFPDSNPLCRRLGVSFRAPGNGRGCFQIGSCADHGGTTEGAHGSGSSCQPIGVSGKDHLSVHLAADSFRCLFRSEAVQAGPDLSGDQGSDGSCCTGISRGVPVRVRCPKQPSPTRLTPVAIATSSVGRGDCQDNGHLSGPGRRQAGL